MAYPEDAVKIQKWFNVIDGHGYIHLSNIYVAHALERYADAEYGMERGV